MRNCTVCALRSFFCGAVALALTSCDADDSDRQTSRDDVQDKSVLKEYDVQDSKQQWTLVEKDREYLWQLEHHANVLVKHGFSSLSTALQTRDTEGLEQIFSSDFEGRIFERPSEIVYEDETLSAIRKEQLGRQERLLNRAQMASLLLEQRNLFSTVPKFQFGVKLLSPTERKDLDQPWTALCVMRMWNASSEQIRPVEVSIRFQVRTVRPTKERLKNPEWLLDCTIQQIATVKSPRFLFREMTAHYGIDTGSLRDNWKSDLKAQNTGGIYACDFNRDGCTDLLVTDANGAGNSFLKGRPEGGFQDVTDEVGLTRLANLPRTTLDADFVDLDGDGWEDLIFARGDVWRNRRGRQFVDLTVQSNFIDHVTGGITSQKRRHARHISVADFDRDGKMDLYVVFENDTPTSWLEDTSHEGDCGRLFRNLGNWQFEDVTKQSTANGGGRSPFTSIWFDANNDRWPDLYVANEFGDGVLYVNQTNGTFREMDVDTNEADFGTMGASCGDIDNDGYIDLYLGSMYSKAGSRVIGNLPKDVYPEEVHTKLRRLISGSQFYQNEGGLSFSAKGEEYQLHDVGWAYGPTLADFNNDGLLDLFATCGYMSRDRGKPDG